ncbi:MAG: O-antigen ligase family protein [Pirellulales bacterium]
MSSVTIASPPAACRKRASGKMTASMLYLCCVPLGAGVGALTDGLTLGGSQLSGFVWSGYLAAGILLLLGRMALDKQIGFTMPIAGWVPWALLVWASLVWGEGIGPHNLQEAVQLTMPLMVGLLASSVIRQRWQLNALFASFAAASIVLLISVPVDASGLLGVKDQGNRAAALSATLFGCSLIALFPKDKAAGLAGWALCLLVTFVTGSRMATAALLAVPILHPLFHRVWLRPLAVASIAVVGVVLFYSPIFQERFFHTGSGTLSDVANGEMLDFGRLDAWPFLLEKASQSPVLGWGTGTAYEYVPQVWPLMHQCHNDYLRVFFETGALGLMCLLFAAFWQVWRLKIAIANSDGRLQQAFAGAYLGLLALLLTSLTDNTLGYNLQFTNPLFVLLGGAFGVAHAERARPESARQDQDPVDRAAPGRISLASHWARQCQGGQA